MIVTAPEVATAPLPSPVPSRNLAEAARYFAASLAALALDAALLWLTVARLGMPPWAGGAIAYGAGLVLIYALSIGWVFARRSVRDARKEFLIFAVIGVGGLLLNSVVLSAGVALGLPLAIAKAVSAGVGFVANFVGRKCVLFTR